MNTDLMPSIYVFAINLIYYLCAAIFDWFLYIHIYGIVLFNVIPCHIKMIYLDVYKSMKFNH